MSGAAGRSRNLMVRNGKGRPNMGMGASQENSYGVAGSLWGSLPIADFFLQCL